MKRTKRTEEMVDEGAWERSGPVNNATDLSTFQLCTHLQAFPGKKSFYRLDGDMYLVWFAVTQLRDSS